VVNQLNPVEQVKIFTEIEGVVLTKYIRIAFTRIERKGMIQSIMVTISDETESVLLQQHLDEAEAKKKQETEQVLTILKIDPAVMRGFIYNTKKLLRNISERYEQSGNKNLLDLLEFTFQTIHNLKGNAAVIGLELMSTKLHNIEESIVKLKSKENISGKDFLSLLYEIDEADSILYEMGETLRKVANIYKKFPSEGQIVSNIMVIDTLEKGVELISKELNKSVDLTFKNDHNIVIPENFINTFKDVMIQLIRNSIVHSIEEPKIREGLGKTTRGNITIKVDQSENDEMVINYKDDGKGLDTKKIKETAIERNLITEFDAKKMSSQQIIDLIFQKGFSTSDKVDNHSGRGQGMSLIKTIIEGKNGSFVVSSESGKFFEMIIKLPLNPNDLTEKAAS
jgi:chemotaxis protein histidine kinase CheA